MKMRSDHKVCSQREGSDRFTPNAGGAQEYSPERSAAELRDITPSGSNPYQRVTKIVPPKTRRCQYGRPFRRPFSGAWSLRMMDPEFRYRFTPGFSSAAPYGRLVNRQKIQRAPRMSTAVAFFNSRRK